MSQSTGCHWIRSWSGRQVQYRCQLNLAIEKFKGQKERKSGTARTSVASVYYDHTVVHAQIDHTCQSDSLLR